MSIHITHSFSFFFIYLSMMKMKYKRPYFIFFVLVLLALIGTFLHRKPNTKQTEDTRFFIFVQTLLEQTILRQHSILLGDIKLHTTGELENPFVLLKSKRTMVCYESILSPNPYFPGEELVEGLEEENTVGVQNNSNSEKEVEKDALQNTLTAETQWPMDAPAEAWMKEFFTIDSTTVLDPSELDFPVLATKDLSVSKEGEGPQILIYHTHGSEAFADSEIGKDTNGVMGAGEVLANILEQEYGYKVLHLQEKFDVESRNYAYSNALPVLQNVLRENPSIEVVIDLHRDEMKEGVKLLSNQNGVELAQVMFFNGISRTRKKGNIDYLENEYLNDNLSFSLQMQLKCREYYPGFARKIYVKGYRYNMHLCPKTLLIELGAQTNTEEEIRNSLHPLAHVLSMVLSQK